LIDPNVVFDDHMTIIMKFDQEIDNYWEDPRIPDGYETTTWLAGRIVSNQTSVNCDVVVLLDMIPRDIGKFAKLLTQPPRFLDPRDVYIQVIDKPARDQVVSLNDFFDRARSQYKKWWPMLLAQNGSIASRSNFLQLIGWTFQGFTQVLGNIINRMFAAGKPLNQEQMSILSGAPYSRAGFKLIRGPPGCGKTTLIAMLAQLYLGAPGVAVMVLAGSNGSTDRSFESLDGWIRKDQNLDQSLWPLRIHKKHVELAHFLDKLDPRRTQAKIRAAKEIAASMLEEENPSDQRLYYERQQHAEKHKHMSDPESGVAAAVLQVLRNNALPKISPKENAAIKSVHDYHRDQAERSLGGLPQYRDRLGMGFGGKLNDEQRYRAIKAF
jgi:AAA domain